WISLVNLGLLVALAVTIGTIGGYIQESNWRKEYERLQKEAERRNREAQLLGGSPKSEDKEKAFLRGRQISTLEIVRKYAIERYDGDVIAAHLFVKGWQSYQGDRTWWYVVVLLLIGIPIIGYLLHH